MDFDSHGKIPGKVAARVVGVFEIIIEIALIIWFIRDVISDREYRRSSLWIGKKRDNFVEGLIGAFFFFGLLFSVLLVYSTFAAASVKMCKRIVTVWCVYRALSFLAAMGLIIQNKSNFDNHCYAIMGVFLVVWALCIYFVSWYLTGLDAEIARQIPVQFRKRKVSTVSALTDEEDGGIDLGLGINNVDDELRKMQWKQFRAYLQRPSWQGSTISFGDDDRGNGNTLAVPECRF